MGQPLFSIIVVTLNAGEKLLLTIDSIRRQTCPDLEVVVKDGGSEDGSTDRLEEERRKGILRGEAFWSSVVIWREPDKSIYEGMNQAVGHACGQYVYFLNCGDRFYSDDVLEVLKEKISGAELTERGTTQAVFYGDIYDDLRRTRVASNPHINGFACYRNVPCHQACVYSRELFEERGYETGYRVRADYEHFLWCYYRKGARMEYVPLIIASYEGGGFSETKENRIRSGKEHRQITGLYMSGWERFLYRAALAATFAPLRTWMAENPALSGFYNGLKDRLYHRKG